MCALTTKTQLLNSLLIGLQQSDSCQADHAKQLAHAVSSQGLLSATAAAREDSLVDWSQAVTHWFRYFLGQLDHEQVNATWSLPLTTARTSSKIRKRLRLQVSRTQAASCILAASLASCDAVRFLEQYNACAIKALQCSGKTPSQAHLWDVVAAVFQRYLLMLQSYLAH